MTYDDNRIVATFRKDVGLNKPQEYADTVVGDYKGGETYKTAFMRIFEEAKVRFGYLL